MAFSTQRTTSDGTLVLLDISIEYFDRSEIAVLFNGVVDAYPWAWVGLTESKISFTPAVPDTVEVMLVRTTDLAQVRHMFTLGAQFTTESLDEDLLQILHIAQEAKENATIEEVFHNLNMHGYRITSIGNGIDPQDAPSMAQMVVHDAQIIVYRDQAAAYAAASAVSAAESAASAASLDIAQFPTPATPDTIPMSNPAGNGWLYKTIAQLKSLLGLGTAAYTDSTAYQAADADIPTVAASQGEMEAGTEANLRSMSPLRVKQAIDALSSNIVHSTVTNTTSGTSIDFTGIPSWVKRITVMLVGVSTNGTSGLLIQLGSGAPQTTGYVATAVDASGSGTGVQSATSGMVLRTFAATFGLTGTLTLVNFSGNSWMSSGVVGRTTQDSNQLLVGDVTLSGVIDRIRLTTVNGTDTFDAGSVNIMYEG